MVALPRVYYSKKTAVVLLLGLLFACSAVYGQAGMRCIILSNIDSAAIPNVVVDVRELHKKIVSDEQGQLELEFTKGIQTLTLTITAIGIQNTVVLHAPFRQTEKIFVDILPHSMSEFSVRGLSAEEVVKKAVAAIPINYADSSYFDYSFYRRYQLVNGRFKNLFEAFPVVMFRLHATPKNITCSEAFAVNELRRSRFYPDIMNENEDNPVDLVVLNPVYYLESSSLNPERFPNYHFRFDTANKTGDYVIRYVCKAFSTDKHGIGDFDERDLKGEEWEDAELVIDRVSFAIKKFHRKSIRYKDYVYKFFHFPNDLVIYDGHKYFFEFTGGDLEVEYCRKGDKWYTYKICRQYTNEFYRPVFYDKLYTITDNFEWYSGETSRYTTADFVDKFYPKMATAIHNYDTAFWAPCHTPFHYSTKEAVYHDLLRDGPMDMQFYQESIVDEYVRIPRKK